MRVAVTVVLAVMASACTSAGAMPIDEYAAAMEETAGAYVREAQDLSERFQSSVAQEVQGALEASAGDAEDAERRVVEITVAATVNYLVLLEDAMGRFVDGMEELRPPSEVVADHDEFLAAVRSVRGSLPTTRERVLSSDSLDGIRLALTSSGFADGRQRWITACRELEATAGELGATMDLGCERGEARP